MAVSITYRLPISWLVVTGNLRITADELAPADKKQTALLAGVEFKVLTTGDSAADHIITPPTGTLMTCKSTFGVAPDGPTSASSDVTGQAGAALKSIASVAGTAAALAMLGPAAAPSDDADKQEITDAYRGAYPDQQALLLDLRAAKKQLLDDLRRELDRSGRRPERRVATADAAGRYRRATRARGHPLPRLEGVQADHIG